MLDSPSLADIEAAWGMELFRRIYFFLDLGKNFLSVSILVYVTVDSHLEAGLGTIGDPFNLLLSSA